MKFFIRLCGVTILALALLLPGALAEAVSAGWRLGAGMGSAKLWVGQQQNRDGLLVYCTDFERGAPDAQAKYTDGHQGGFVRSDGSVLSAHENAAISYLLLRWGKSKDNATAAAVQLAIWSLSSSGRAWGSPGMAQILAEAALPASVVALGRSLTDQALRYAGPYRVTAKLVRPGAAEVQVFSSTGVQTPGLAVQLTTSGSLKLSGGPSHWLSTNQSQLVPVQRTDFGKGSLTAMITAAPLPILRWLQPAAAGQQRLITSAVTGLVTGSLTVPAATAFQAVVRTTTSTASLSGPGKLHDNLVISTTAAGPWLQDPGTGKPVQATVVSTLWGPFKTPPVEAAVAPSGAPTVGTVSTNISGTGQYSTTELAVSAPGYYVWTERIDALSARPSSARDYLKPWSGRFGLAPETTLLRWSPVLTTELSGHLATVGSKIVDRLSVAAAPPTTRGVQVTLSMYGPLPVQPEQSKDVPPGSPLLTKLTLPLADGATANFGSLNKVGCYTVVATLPESAAVNSFHDDFGEPSETVCLQTAPAAPPQVVVPKHPQAPARVPVSAAKPVPVQAAIPLANPLAPHPEAPPQLAATGTTAEGGFALGAAVLIGSGISLLLVARGRKLGRLGKHRG
ncbi:hypothetical protein FHU41_002434 [Psychromicrobium silvestre]|uniref:Uncharacterized protein n=1 Tax=Psychromicrobium silvestre TaxID=1645614 RepID=A0A7Y9S7Q0_9MICC|nr:hypothetical protein [Psychromicrobium silvestre]NYE96184.1 hypothetical protein [Psychromicrobium silvestre]